MTSIYNSLFEHSVAELADMLGTSEEQARLLLPTAMIYEKIMRINNASAIYFSTTDLCDGIFAQYAIKSGLVPKVRDFEKDVLSAARKIALRYNSNTKHTAYVEKLALKIFDSMTSTSGLDKRDRLLLQVAVRLHDCGAYVNFEDVASNSYKIITSTEIIGLTRKENILVANIVGNPVKSFPSYDEVWDDMTEREYIRVAKLSAIFRIANDLDTSKNQKLAQLKITLRDNRLTISGESLMNCALEQAYFKQSAAFFEQTFGIYPVIKRRRINNV
jgi:exopolyphosphatase/guanosine-5'-triphosphate,3'-diphosphate pyrophosphatase